MAAVLFRVLAKSFIGGALREPGDLVDIDPAVMRPGPNLEAVGGSPASKPAEIAPRRGPKPAAKQAPKTQE